MPPHFKAQHLLGKNTWDGTRPLQPMWFLQMPRASRDLCRP